MAFNRREFMTSTLGAGLGGCFIASRSSGWEKEDKVKNLSKASLPTPALLLDLEAFEANLRAMAEYCRQTGRGFRPHAKTHKCPEIARRQIQSGAIGICVATVPEAEAMIDAGLPGVLLTSPIVETGKIARVVELAKASGQLMVSVGDVRQVDLLDQATAAARVPLDVLVDVDVIDRRTGALPGAPALEVARRIDEARYLKLRGVQAYAGAASHTIGFAKREQVSRTAMAKAVETRELMAKSGLEVPILSGGSTGTYNIDSHIPGVTELQVGSYVFMDAGYMSIGSKSGSEVYNDFRPSLTVLTTVVSTTHADLVTVDAGVKAFAESPDPLPKESRGLKYRRFGDEFGALTATAGTPLPRLGERLELIVPHCDPTVNLYDQIHVMRGEQVDSIWPITARRNFR